MSEFFSGIPRGLWTIQGGIKGISRKFSVWGSQGASGRISEEFQEVLGVLQMAPGGSGSLRGVLEDLRDISGGVRGGFQGPLIPL